MTQEEQLIKRVAIWGNKLIRMFFSRWRFLTLYLVFAGIALNGWYIDVAGWFSNSDDYAATIRAQYGDINILNVITFLIGSLVFVVYLWADVKHKRLEKMIVGDVTVKNSSVFGDASQTTTTGEHSHAVNAPNGNVTINNITNGITEERCRNIFDEKLPIALQDYSAEAVIVAKDRTFKFKQKLVPRLGEEENGFESFADPSFQFLLIEAQKAAASSDRDSDYEVLSELLVNRVKMGEDRKLHIGVNKAVSMLPFISDEQLAGMTVNLCLNAVSPKSNNIIEALTTLNECYQKIIGDVELPKGSGWLDSLEAGGLIKNMGILSQQFKKSNDLIPEFLGEYARPGIKKDGKQYQQAIRIIQDANLPDNILIDHELNEDYVRLAILSEQHIEDIKFTKELGSGIKMTIYLKEEQKEAIKQVFDLFNEELSVKEDFKNRFMNKYNEFAYLKKITEWWDSLPIYYELTIVGKILANANANKCDARIPIFVK